MKVLVTGAGGFLGRHVLAALKQKGVPTTVIGRHRPAAATFAEFIEADLLAGQDIKPLLAATNASHLLHLAWYTEHGVYWKSELNLRWLEATVRLVEAFCACGGSRVVAAGTCAEYDWSYGYCREDSTPLNPASLYGISKDATRRLLAAVCEKHHVDWAWGRVFFPYGSGDSPDRLIPSLIKVFRHERVPFGVNSANYRDFVHAADVGDAFVTLLTSHGCGSYNICSGKPVSIEDLVCRIASAMNADPTMVLRLPVERSIGPTVLVGENSKLEAVGWRPSIKLSQGLEMTITKFNEA